MDDHWLPEWFRIRSWWVKWSFGGGLAFLSAFLPTILDLSWQKLGVGVGIILFLISLIGGTWEGLNEWRSKHNRPPLTYPKIPARFLILIVTVPLMALAVYYERPTTPIETEPLLLQRMRSDFVGMNALSGLWDVYLSKNNPTRVQVIIYSDMRSLAKFITFYVPRDVFETCKHLAARLDDIAEGPPMLTINGEPVHTQMRIISKVEGDPNFQSSENEKFTGAVYVYYEGYLSDEQRVELRKLFSDHNVTLIFRGHEFMNLESK
jgi:hypothetical protein